MDMLFEMLQKLGGGRGDIHMDNVHSMSFVIVYIYIVYFILTYKYVIPKSLIYLIYLSFSPLTLDVH